MGSRDLKLICISAFIFFFGDGLFSFLLPLYMNQLNASPTEVGVLYSIYYLTLGITLMLGGFLADRYDRKKIVILGSLLWIPVPLALSAATNWDQLWLPMILYGTWFGASSTNLYVLKSSPSGKTMQAFGLWSASVALGYVFSPLLGGFLSSAIGKQAVFYIATSFFAVSVVPLVFISRPQKAESKEKQANSNYSLDHFTFDKRLIALCSFLTIIIFAIFLIGPLIPQFITRVYNQTLINVGFFGTVFFAGWFFFSFVLGRIGDKRSKMAAVIISTAVSSFSLLMIAITNNFMLLFFAFFLLGTSRCIIGFTPAIIGSSAPKGYDGRWISIGLTTVNMATFAAPVVGGVVYEVSPYLVFFIAIFLLSSMTVFAAFKKL